MKIDETLDLRGLPCPGNLPKLLIKLETMDSGEILKLTVDDMVALDRIPSALKEESAYELLEIKKGADSNILIYIKVI
ncbi:MAG: sulfurtransferase TusA family protein [Bacteroidales bacterium]|jgi:TusA-related sulfurtransferase|nr:sulfurtransferase TusA family protein [Bacteroidales bacterium]MCK9612293.1 sulfurtransferase TusA family protein [Bacteroidales bacterium]MDD4213378.1 sulfurtransferase TusA family protein [Bacteroidales bacterium]